MEQNELQPGNANPDMTALEIIDEALREIDRQAKALQNNLLRFDGAYQYVQTLRARLLSKNTGSTEEGQTTIPEPQVDVQVD